MGGGTIASQLTAIKAGTIRALAICGNQRWEDLPDVPTTAELGYPTITYDQWNGISGPPNLSAEVVQAWEEYVQEMAQDPGIAAQLKTTGAWPQYLGSEQLRRQVQKTGDEMRVLWK
jgi:tripartite-type tricarboxylate transporter receptor subunit TctC